jgi:putative PEP-CTERM system histidine kinase
LAAVLIFALCAAAFLLLALLSLTAWRSIAAGSRLLPALLFQALWSIEAALSQSGRAVPLVLVVTVEIARNICWVAFLQKLLAPVLQSAAPSWLSRALSAIVLALPAVALAAPLWFSGDALLVFLFDLQRWSGLLLAITGLVLVEQFARNARRDLQWEVRYLWLGIGIVFANDLAIWSISLLFGQVDGLLQSTRGSINAAVAVLLAVALRRMPAPVGAGLLRKSGSFFFNTTLVFAGAYVLLMAAASVLLRGGEQGARSLVEALFVGASLVVLAVALFSSQFRAWSRVTLSKFLLPYRYDYRDVWLTLTRELSETSDVPVRRRAAQALASFVNSSAGEIWERDEDVYRPAESAPRAGRPASVQHDAFFECLRRREWVFDAAAWRESSHDAATLEDQGSRPPAPPRWLTDDRDLWLVVPLLSNNELVGFAMLERPMASTTLGWEQLDLLRAAGRQIGSFLAFERTANRLAELHQFEALNRLSGFVMHDLRHLVAQLALVVDNAARHRNNPEFIDDAILTIDSSAKRMTSLMDALRTGVAAVPDRRVALAELLRGVVRRCHDRVPQPRLVLESEELEATINRERVEQALEHLLRNAQAATLPDGQIFVTLRPEAQGSLIEIADTGCGMDAEFLRTRLFKPFDSTKGEQGMGLGAFEARDIIRRHGGSLSVESSVGKGTIFRITLPHAPTLPR